MPIPVNWEPVPCDPDIVTNVIAKYPWGTHGLVVATKYPWGTHGLVVANVSGYNTNFEPDFAGSRIVADFSDFGITDGLYKTDKAVRMVPVSSNPPSYICRLLI